ncbi:hypothetical protein M406DRAFT_288543 [Cryphonectria parasitica EP155]|uniref:polynucleotide adenylyltransferase n=1 Tax=Cryphonectria parasitica (strain ATCC 38755 / EP155) TaxID=660469 RepID=A0A9P4Y6I7_CRYP1|nr:uncharacterized protein M406DRAFT_288543 [Cryphonectria parasitica EP155]KAF3767468.1 hypothetical protein M406DRAFT_288543 [Cryphonectria parasitica EP155]
MGGLEQTAAGGAAPAVATVSHDTALCIVPPRSLWPRIDRLRSRYDKAYGKWPPHVNLIYPFVQVDALPRALELVRSAVQGRDPFRVQFGAADVFRHRHDNTIFLYDDDEARREQLGRLRQAILVALGARPKDAGGYRMHMSLGQSEDVDESWHHFLLEKARLLPGIEWEVDELHLLVRERVQVGDSLSAQMKGWATISLKDGTIYQSATLQALDDGNLSIPAPEAPYNYDGGQGWKKISPDRTFPETETAEDASSTTLAVATYNVLAEFQYPPSHKRYPLLIENILSKKAKTDVLALQEVTDDFLSYLLADQNIRQAFPFCSHGPPNQEDVEPLPSHNNIIVLSRHAFEWESVPFNREHKNALVVKFQGLGRWDDADFTPLILATVHLTHGLKDGSIAAKKSEIDKMLKYLAQNYPDHPTVLAGDFNITSSAYTISQALERNVVSAQAATHLRNLDATFTRNGFVDAWTVFQLEKGAGPDEEVIEFALEGEQGATYDPTVNALAAEIVGSGFGMRPQRIDRVLAKGDGFLHVLHFNKFGDVTTEANGESGPQTLYASDHWGIRTVLKLGFETESTRSATSQLVPVQSRTAKGALADSEALETALQNAGAIPSDEDIRTRAAAFHLLKGVILDTSSSEPAQSATALIFLPVGSYGLGVWTLSSDIDCLCIGPFSAPTFFSLATERLRKAADRGVRIIRRVKANTGTMLELDLQGARFDLQYASAQAVVELWPAVLRFPTSHAVWRLSSSTLSKLRAIRDLDYVRHSVPDMTKFARAHRLIKTWAKNRGIYTAKFGYLGGFQITILLARVYKLLARDAALLSVADVLATFFHHYADFAWKRNLVFDPFFHKTLNYRRTDREPLAILGYFPPALNTSLAASTPSVRTIAAEFKRAASLLSEESMSMTWPKFVNSDGTFDFLRGFRSYVKIDVQFWGGSITKGRGFVGWVESRCVSLLVDLNRRAPALHARFWPARWTEKSEDTSVLPHRAGTPAADDDSGGDYQGCYLIGLDKLKEDNMSTEDEKVMYGTLLSVLGRFAEQIRGDTRHFDAQSSWMSASVVKAAEVGSLQVDRREWGKYAIGEDDESDDEDGEDAAAAAQNHSLGDEYEDQNYAPKKKKPARAITNQPRAVVVPKPEGAGRFRTAADVLNRLRWDPSLDSADHVVGYEDRFLGAMEKALDAWKLEQTHEEFIPQHRILYFKRKSDGVVVWERRTRKDLLFGSG